MFFFRNIAVVQISYLMKIYHMKLIAMY